MIIACLIAFAGASSTALGEAELREPSAPPGYRSLNLSELARGLSAPSYETGVSPITQLVGADSGLYAVVAGNVIAKFDADTGALLGADMVEDFDSTASRISDIAVSDAALWLATDAGVIEFEFEVPLVIPLAGATSVAVLDDRVWAANSEAIWSIDPQSNTSASVVEFPDELTAARDLVVTRDHAWLLDAPSATGASERLWRFDLENVGAEPRVYDAAGATSIAVSADAVWADADGELLRIDMETGAEQEVVLAGCAAAAIWATAGHVFVAFDHRVVRIDAAQPDARVHTAYSTHKISAIAVARDRLYAAAGAPYFGQRPGDWSQDLARYPHNPPDDLCVGSS